MPFIPDQFPDLPDGKDNPGFIIGPHHTDHRRVVAEVPFQVVEIEPALAVHRHEGHPVASLGQRFTQVFDRRMFHPGGDDVFLAGI